MWVFSSRVFTRALFWSVWLVNTDIITMLRSWISYTRLDLDFVQILLLLKVFPPRKALSLQNIGGVMQHSCACAYASRIWNSVGAEAIGSSSNLTAPCFVLLCLWQVYRKNRQNARTHAGHIEKYWTLRDNEMQHISATFGLDKFEFGTQTRVKFHASGPTWIKSTEKLKLDQWFQSTRRGRRTSPSMFDYSCVWQSCPKATDTWRNIARKVAAIDVPSHVRRRDLLHVKVLK